MNKLFLHLVILLTVLSCQQDGGNDSPKEIENQDFISGVDISSYPEIAGTNPTFYDTNGDQKAFLDILKADGVNTIRLRLWVNPVNEHSGFGEVKEFSQTLKNKGFKTWLTVHYSDTWADPGRQETPAQWQGLSIAVLKDSVYNYTAKVVREMQPDYVQIGNEINPGFLHPSGNITDHYSDFMALMESGCKAVRENSTDCKIILHFAGIENSTWFFDQVKSLDYDIIGLSYYPKWHGKSLDDLQSNMQSLSSTHGKKILIAETAYPFTLQWNDQTNNIVGLNEQLILPEFPPTVEGQRNFIQQIRNISEEVENGIGFCYWGAELIAWKGTQATDGSPWENQALFDFQNKALPVLEVFKND
ncbi:MAG: glycosyl hydrolase 53 family protein [Muricauda sp.]|nr:glycosyl hydrolase 53 family protein [Allomuricauda sp.]